jgi:uncharacterized protein YciI
MSDISSEIRSEKEIRKKHYLLKSISCRPTFSQDMTPEERVVMSQHIAYWTDKLNSGIVLVFGPVFDKAGVYGIAIMGVQDESEVHLSIELDPAVKAGLLTTELSLMNAVLPE